jgi:uncharacterized protein (TIGR02217 family)
VSFLESPRFSDRIARGMAGGPAFSTEVVVTAAGGEQRNQNWSQARREYDAAIAVRTLADFAEIEAHFLAVKGRALGFRFRDVADCRAEYVQGLLQPLTAGLAVGAAGLGYGVPVYQLVKRYVRGLQQHDREIRKPVVGSVAIRRAGAPVPFGGGSGQVALDTATGLATFGPDQSRTVSAQTVGAQHVFTLSSAFSPNVAVGQRVWVSTVAGTAAAVLNDRSHEVAAVSGAQVTIATSTTGLAAAGGVLSLYPQPGQVLDWAGEFDVPVRFDVDKLARRVISRSPSGEYLVECDSIPLIEVRV